jgi:NitT/TauT family transport system substrate-binding protein
MRITREALTRRTDRLRSWAISAVCAASAFGLVQPTPAESQQLTRVRYVFALPALFDLLANQTSIPKHLGYYAEEGVDVEITTGGTGTSCTQLVASGQQDICSGGQSFTIARAAEGQDLGLVFFYNHIRQFNYVLGVMPDSPYREMTDLKGKKIGVTTLASEGVVSTRYFARDAGLDPDKDITFIATGFGAQGLHALQNKRVDALANLPSFFTQLELLGQNFRYLPLPFATKGVFGPGLATRRDYLQKNRQVLIGVGRAVAKSALFMLTNPEAAVRIHWKMYPERRPQGVAADKALRDAVAVLRVENESVKFSDNVTQKLFGHYTPESWMQYLRVYNYADKISDPSRFYTNELIAEINKFDRDKVIAQAREFRLQ